MRSVERHSSEQYVSPSFVCFSQTRHQSQSTPSIGGRYGICGEGMNCVGVCVCCRGRQGEVGGGKVCGLCCGV